MRKRKRTIQKADSSTKLVDLPFDEWLAIWQNEMMQARDGQDQRSIHRYIRTQLHTRLAKRIRKFLGISIYPERETNMMISEFDSMLYEIHELNRLVDQLIAENDELAEKARNTGRSEL